MNSEKNTETKKGDDELRHFSGMVFVACMFIGGGIGLAFGRPDVGGAIGMGVGFLLMGFFRVKNVKPTPVTLSLPKAFGSLILTIIGILLILAGILIFYNPELLYPYLVGFALIIIGLMVLVSGLKPKKP
jgi:uncharacterized membrane protein HdeD (DUF308 family)